MKININWAWGVVIAFALFITFILYFVFKASFDDSYNQEMVIKNYYEQELSFEEDLLLERKSKKEGAEVKVKVQQEGLAVGFPGKFDPSQIRGNILFYRPSDEQLDFELPLILVTSEMMIPKKMLQEGRWDIQVRWEYKGSSYLTKTKITF